jgi:DNA-directed RNA polymerase subunit RPC12/RpoP
MKDPNVKCARCGVELLYREKSHKWQKENVYIVYLCKICDYELEKFIYKRD